MEAILLSHPKVSEAGVVGLPDELAGELPIAFVVKKIENVTENELQQFVASKYWATFFVVSDKSRISKTTVRIETLEMR